MLFSRSQRESVRVATASFVEYLSCCRLLLKNTFVLVQEEESSLRPATLSQSEPSGQTYRLSDCTYHRVFVSLCTLSCFSIWNVSWFSFGSFFFLFGRLSCLLVTRQSHPLLMDNLGLQTCTSLDSSKQRTNPEGKERKHCLYFKIKQSNICLEIPAFF